MNWLKPASLAFASMVVAFVAGCSGSAEAGVEPSSSTTAEGLSLAHMRLALPYLFSALAAPPEPCVEPGRYVITDDVVVDLQNDGRLWQRAVDPAQRTQPDALAYCESLDLGGRSGWRLPAVQELQSIRLRPSGLSGGPQYCMPSIDQVAFPDTPAAEFWSATLRHGENEDGLYTEFDDGRTHPSPLDTPMFVRCVRDGAPDARE